MNNQEKISNQPPDYMDINYADKHKRTTHTPLPRLLGISGKTELHPNIFFLHSA